MGMRYGVAVAMALCVSAPSYAQQNIEWKQTVNVPKGKHVPAGRADILGIEFGDTYAEAKAKLEKLETESKKGKPDPSACSSTAQYMRLCGEASEPSITEGESLFNIRGPNHSAMTARYVSLLEFKRSLPGAGSEKIVETIKLHLSAPSSGHQVVGIERDMFYPEADQPQIGAVLDAVQKKYEASPRVFRSDYIFQFDNGQAVTGSGNTGCEPQIRAMTNLNTVREVNSKGDCDVVMRVNITKGVSANHVKILKFEFADNERIRINGVADYTYIQTYLKSLQSRTLGAPPKL